MKPIISRFVRHIWINMNYPDKLRLSTKSRSPALENPTEKQSFKVFTAAENPSISHKTYSDIIQIKKFIHEISFIIKKKVILLNEILTKVIKKINTIWLPWWGLLAKVRSL